MSESVGGREAADQMAYLSKSDAWWLMARGWARFDRESGVYYITRVRSSGSAAQNLCEVCAGRGGHWTNQRARWVPCPCRCHPTVECDHCDGTGVIYEPAPDDAAHEYDCYGTEIPCANCDGTGQVNAR